MDPIIVALSYRPKVRFTLLDSEITRSMPQRFQLLGFGPQFGAGKGTVPLLERRVAGSNKILRNVP